MKFLSIDEILKRYGNAVSKAERLGTTNNEHYREKKSVVYWLNILNKQDVVIISKELYNKEKM